MMRFYEEIFAFLFPQKFKNHSEYAYWKKKYSQEKGVLNHDHYKFFYTSYFGLEEKDYRKKSILDIGCGPRGSLEWAHGAQQRIGLDPLVTQYKNLGIEKHAMTYIDACAEEMPFCNNSFDIITSFNSLDHVDDITKTLKQISRVLKHEGTFLLITEINHPPTPTEPHTLDAGFLSVLNYFFTPQEYWFVNMKEDVHDIYGSLRENRRVQNLTGSEPAILCYKSGKGR